MFHNSHKLVTTVSEMGKNRKLFFMDIFQLRLGITLLSKNKTLEMKSF